VAGINVGTYVQSKVVMQNGQATHRHRAETVANTAVNASAFADRVGFLRNAHILASGNPMKTLQERLRQHQFYAGRIDGNYGPALRIAIEAYEKANTLPVTGLATQGLLLRLSGQQMPVMDTPQELPQQAQRSGGKR
jgi:protease YdgD